MGLCWSENPRSDFQINVQLQPSDIEALNQQKKAKLFNDENFKDMPEWDGEKYKGYGIKQMKAYKCDLPINELNELRDKFWHSKIENQNEWKIIHQACVYDHIKSEEFLSNNKFRTLKGCINQCVDRFGNIYYVPNYCINDPYFELELLPQDKSKGKIITIKLIDVSGGNNVQIEANENIKGNEIVKMYADKNNIDLNKNKIRLLFGGGIIRDNESLFQHKIKDGFSIQICVTPID